ncbi:MAG: alpha/beta hydrolase [Oscillochloris sp.]|nr:alpha/beta hydrolase [Oscillochloris sp.]
MATDEDRKEPIRRGRGLRLSTQAASGESPAEPAADKSAPITRGRGLHLTTEESVTTKQLFLSDLNVPTGRIVYYSAGEGPPLLMLHGFGASGRIWRNVAATLSDRRTCYAPDIPGFGGSPPRTTIPTLDVLADEVIAFADALDIAHFDLLGHSLGAAIAATIAAQYPRRIGRLALTSLAIRPFAPELMALAANRLPLDVSLNLARPVLDIWRPWTSWAMVTPPPALLLGSQLLANAPVEVQLWQEFLSDHAQADGRAYLTSVTAPGDPVLIAYLPAIKAPTLLISGHDDRVARLPEVVMAQQRIAAAQLHTIAQCGHLPMIERPQEYHAILAEFFH